jgi:hypothetical protein
MNEQKNTITQNPDDRLAEFTDEVLTGRMQQPASTANEDLLLLEDTVLRLNKVLPPAPLDEARAKQMLVRLKNRIKREEQATQQTFLQRLFTRPQTLAVVGVLSALVVMVLVMPLMTTAGSSTTATALNPSRGIYVALGVAVVLAIVLWLRRQK